MPRGHWRRASVKRRQRCCAAITCTTDNSLDIALPHIFGDESIRDGNGIEFTSAGALACSGYQSSSVLDKLTSLGGPLGAL